jgi:AcrR family transcriptional regulator
MTTPAGDPPAHRNYPKGHRRRTEIIQAALLAFGAVGYRNATMVQIAADCGVSRAGLLHHFPTKELLLEAVLEERDRQDEARFFPQQRSDDGLAYLTAMLDLVHHNQANPGIVSLFATLSTEAAHPDHPAHDYFIARYEHTRAQMRAALADLADRQLLRDKINLDGLDTELIALIDGLQIQWLLAPHTIDMPARLLAHLNDLLATPMAAHWK